MTNPGANPARTLEEELAGARRLLALLQQEQTHLIQADIAELERLTQEKAAVVAGLFELSKLRHDDLKASGYSGAESDMQAWLDSIPSSNPAFAATRRRWAELLEVTGSAKELNRVNGLLIGSHMGRNQAALNALRVGSDAGGLYGPDGQTGKGVTGRGIIA